MKQLRTIRKERGIPVSSMAHLLGLSESTYRAYELNPPMFRLNHVIIISEALQIQIEDIDWYHPYVKERQKGKSL